MGEVWVAHRNAQFSGASKAVAVKLMATAISDLKDSWRLFESEARLSMMLSHSNIVQVFDVGVHDGRGYLAMEWVDGINLAVMMQYLRDRGQSVSYALAAFVIGEMLHGLAYAHMLVEEGETKAIIHRDISPHNVLASVSGEVKITDFGIARVGSEHTSGVHIRGKLRYMPPEQAAGDSRRPATDLFAVGATLHELVSGEGFRAEVPTERLFAHVAAGLTPSLNRPDAPPQLLHLLARLLEQDPFERVQSAGEALVLLREWPGYRDCRTELAEIVRDVSGVEGPRSGLYIAPRTTSWVRSAISTSEKARQPTIATVQAQSGQHECSTYLEHVGSAIEPPRSRPVRGSLRRSRVFAVIALGSIVGIMAGWASSPSLDRSAGWSVVDVAHANMQPESPSKTPVTTPERGFHSSQTRDGIAPPPVRERPREVTPPPVRPSGVTDAAGLGPRRAKAATQRPAEPTKLPAFVTFSSGEFHWLEIEVGSRRLTLDSRASVSLDPGRYTVKLRTDDGSWRSVGRLDLDAEHSYRVDFTLPGGFRLTTDTRPQPP
jgi:serine/threonine protein kinase